MQGFFVEAKTDVKELNVNFTAEMIKVTDGDGNAGPLKVAGRGDTEFSLLNISAVVDGEVVSRAVVNLTDGADLGYDSTEDVAMLADPTQKNVATVFTVAAGKALSINSLDRIDETEIGVIASQDVKTSLLFENVDGAAGLKLFDAVTGEFYELYDGMTYEVEGPVAGRLYLVSYDKAVSGGNDIAVVRDGRNVSVVSSVYGVTVRVYDAVGLCIGEWVSDSNSLSFDLTPGISLVEAMAGGNKITRKFIVK